MRSLVSSLLLVGLTLLSGPLLAQQSPSATVEGALEAHFSAESNDATALRDGGYSYERLLVAEMLPSDSALMAEVELTRDDTRLRYPIKLSRKLAGDRLVWQVAWSPHEAYARALVELSSGEGFAANERATAAWADIERLPALPVIVASDAFVTPYGRVAADGDAPAADAQRAALEELGKHAQRWVGLTLEDEPGTANVDLLLGKDVSWPRATQALMAPASQGLFRTYLVSRSSRGRSGGVVALATAAPVVRNEARGTKPLVVGMHREGDQRAVRVRIGDELVASTKACAEQVTFCAETLDEFEQRALNHIVEAIRSHDAKVAHVMFAATGEFSASEVAEHLTALSRALGVDSQKIFVGYIRGEQ